MKKRIICLILTVVMLSLSLASCGFSFVDDDLSAYATFDKEGFEAAIKALSIEDGDFTTDPETREKKVLDKIYSTLADVATEKGKTEGVIGAHDILFYCYYMTAEKDGKTIQIAPDYMKTSKTEKVQLGIQFPTTLQTAILEQIAGYDFGDKDNDYKNVSTGNAAAGDVALISYTYTYDTTVDGTTKTISDSVTLQVVVLDEADKLHYNLMKKVTKAEKEGEEDKVEDLGIGKTANDFTIEGGYVINGETVNEKITISKGKIEYVVKGNALQPITETTYTEKKEMKDIYGNNVDLKDLPITYYVYPVNYTVVDEFNAVNVLDLVYGSNLTAEIFGNMLFGVDFSAKEADKQKELSKDYVITENEKTIEFADFATSIVDALKKYTDAKKTYETEKTNLEKAEDNVASAETEASKSDLTADEKTAAENALKSAKEALSKQQISLNTAKTELDKAEKDKDIKIVTAVTKDADFAKALVELRIASNEKKDALKAAEEALEAAKDALEDAKEAAEAEGATEADQTAYAEAQTKVTEAEAALTKAQSENDDATANLVPKEEEFNTKSDELNKKFVEGYENLIYSDLQETYRTTVEQNIAKKVYELIEKYVTVNSVPEEVANDVFDQLYENYEYCFYADQRLESDTTTTSNPGFYKTYNASFKQFVVGYAVPTEIGKKVESYDEAVAAMQEYAEAAVKPILRMYVVAKAYDLVFTDDELDEYEDENKDIFVSGEYYYGEDAVRNALQLNKLMNYFIESEETEDGKVKKDVYKNVVIAEYTKAED